MSTAIDSPEFAAVSLRMACHVNFLDKLGAEMRERLLDGHRNIQIPVSHQLIFQSDWGDEIYILSSGILKARCLNAEGEEVVVGLLGAGALVRAVALLQAERLTALGNRLMLMSEDATTRLLATLLDLAYLNGEEAAASNPIPSLSQQEIAVISCLSRGTTSTLVNKFPAMTR